MEKEGDGSLDAFCRPRKGAGRPVREGARRSGGGRPLMAMVAAPIAEEGEGNGRRSEGVEVVLHRTLMVRTEGGEGYAGARPVAP